MEKLVLEIPIHRGKDQSLEDAAHDVINKRLGSEMPMQIAESVVAHSDTECVVLKDRHGKTGTFPRFLVPVNADDQNKNIVFYAGSDEMLRLEDDGRIYVRGKLADTDKAVVDGMRELISRAVTL